MGKPAPLACAVACFLLLGQPSAAGDLAPDRRSYDEAVTLYLRGDFRAALTLVNKAIEADPRLALPFALRARIWDVLGDPFHMEDDCTSFLSKLSRRPGALAADELIAQGSVFLLKGESDQALANFNTALRVLNKSPEGFAARARAWRAKGDYAQEAADLDAAIQLSPQALYYHNRAHAYYDLGRYDQAVTDLIAALQLNKESHISLGLLGSVLARKGDPARALQAYNKAIALNPEYAYAYLGRAAVYLAQGEDAAAFKDFAEAVRVGAHDYAPWFNRAEAYWRRGRRDEALADYRKVMAADLRDASYALLVGDRFAHYLLWNEAIDAYTRAAALSRGVTPLVRRAAAWEALKNYKKAMADLTAAVTAEPASTSAWVARGLLAADLGLRDQALADLTRAVNLDAKSPGARVARGSFYARTGKAALALADFNAALSADPNLAEAYNNRGALYANALNDSDKALNDIVSAVVLEPQNPGYQFNLGMMRFKARHYQKAIAAFNTALSLKGPAARILQARAEAQAQLGDHAAALRDIQTSLEKDPRNPAVYDTLGSIRLAAHDYEQAVRDLNQALRINADFVPALIHRGAAYGGLGSLKNARNDFRRAAELEPRSKEAWTGLGTVQRLQNDHEEAVQDCTHALEIDPSHGPAYLQRGLAYLHLREPERAISDIHHAYELGVRRAEGLLGQSYGHALAKQYKEAHQTYLAAMSLDPNAKTFQAGFGAPRGDADDYFTAMADIAALMAPAMGLPSLPGRRSPLLEGTPASADPYACIVRADAMHNAGHYDKAVLEYTKAMELDGTIAEAYVGRGNCLLAQEAYDAAQQDFIRAGELDPADAGPHLREATLLTIRRNYKDAMAEISAALKIDPKNPEAYLRAGNVYYFQGDYQKALENYETAAKYDPGSAAAYNGVGLGYFALHKHPEALENFSRAIALGPYCDRYYRNRASTYSELRKFSNAAAEFQSASLVNTDPDLVEEYQKLIKDAAARIGNGGT